MKNALLRIGPVGEGGFTFGLSTAAYSELKRTAKAVWSGVSRLGNYPAQQHTGREETLRIRGTVYGATGAGQHQLRTLRSVLDAAQPLPLVTAAGDHLGRWVLASVEETQTKFLPGGVPRKQAYDLELKFYDDGTGNAL